MSGLPPETHRRDYGDRGVFEIVLHEHADGRWLWFVVGGPEGEFDPLGTGFAATRAAAMTGAELVLAERTGIGHRP